MSTLSVPLNPQEQAFIKSFIESGQAENKAQVVRRALRLLREEELVQSVLRAQREVTVGKVLYGDLRELVKQF